MSQDSSMPGKAKIARDVRHLKGIVPPPSKSVSLEAMKRAIGKGA